MDEARLSRVEQDLVAWGLIERSDEGLTWSRRFRGAVMREAARLAQLERSGERPPGHPLETAVQAAVATPELPADAALTAAHQRFLVAIELAALPEAVRDLWG